MSIQKILLGTVACSSIGLILAGCGNQKPNESNRPRQSKVVHSSPNRSNPTFRKRSAHAKDVKSMPKQFRGGYLQRQKNGGWQTITIATDQSGSTKGGIEVQGRSRGHIGNIQAMNVTQVARKGTTYYVTGDNGAVNPNAKMVMNITIKSSNHGQSIKAWSPQLNLNFAGPKLSKHQAEAFNKEFQHEYKQEQSKHNHNKKPSKKNGRREASQKPSKSK